ncbi:PREDICTED: uncharacterized protein PF14_0093-like [Trachymyrmex cornetzi]|uniref:uncharacterized protein PF14_0093-like n=1 Tax=Trachymyrmex cornetzi TaxID=471704 RepID=UPI00084ED660|nr:PREDICTED: uncharacterized protein PF14_0093-like [Trachymyrmex cornetzi]
MYCTSMESMKISTDNENYLDEENLNVTDCNSKMQEISSKSIKKYNNNNLCTISSVINGRVCNVRSEQFETNQNSKAIFSSIINTDIENKILGTSEDKTNFKSKNKISSDENILNTSNLVDVSENCNATRSLVLVNKKEAIKQNRKRIAAEENTIKLDNKKKKLNRTLWLQNNVTHIKLLNPQEFDFPNINTAAESNISEENIPVQKIDLREHLNKKRSKSPKLFENKFNNKTSTESEQIDLNNKNDIITPTNTMKDKKFYKRLSFEEEPTFNKTLCKEIDTQTDSICNNRMHSMLQSASEKTQHLNQIGRSIHENANIQEEHMNSRNEDDDCISLFAESFDTNFCENTVLCEQDKLSKSLHSDLPYIMTASSFNKYMKQNATEFNKEYAKCVEDNIETSNKTNKTDKNEFSNQPAQITHTDCISETRTTSKVTALETKNVKVSKCQGIAKINLKNFLNGYCFSTLRKGTCYKQQLCKFKHELQNLLSTICSEDPTAMLNIVQNAFYLGYNFFCRTIYIISIQKLTVDQILTIYKIFHDSRVKEEMTLSSKRYIIQNIIKELLNRQLSLKAIVNHLVEYIPIKDSNNLMNILECIEKYIKRGEYWNTVRTLVLRLPPDKRIIEKILYDCIENEKLFDVRDINRNLISKVPPKLISMLDKNILERFKSILTEKIDCSILTANNSHSTVQNFGESLSETIASPDGSMSLSQESLRRDNTVINKSKDHVNIEINGQNYLMQPIDDLPDARSVYRDHEHLWKFYVDLDRFKKGLLHHDYDYVINILKNYTEKQDESPLFVRSCCNILRTEVKRSEYHLRNIIRRTVQMGTFDILGKILFDIGLNILINSMDNEAWGLALGLIQTLNIHDLQCNAEYFLLSAEIYLANKKAVKAYDLLKYKNILRTSRDKWFVKSTVNDEHVRTKIMYILLDSFCNEFVEYAFFLFQFLLKDQSSQYYPIDLSRYVDKLMMLSLSKKDSNLITEMANLVLKYTFALSTTTCRALVSTLIHMNENLARQMYNYAEGIGIYPAVKLWPVTHVIINTDLTEEEIYLTFLQLLKHLIINVGHAIEFAKPYQIKVYLILEIKSINEQFYSVDLQNYNNNKAITNIKALVRNVLKRFDPPILMPGSKGRIYKLQSKSVINYLKTEHCN